MNTQCLDRQRELTDTPENAEPDFAALSERVFRLCAALLGSLEAAGDAAQESLTRSWARRNRKRSDVSWWTWSAGFAIRVCRERRRSRAVRFRVRLLSEPDGAADFAESGLKPFQDPMLVAAIQSLPRRQKEVTVLRFLSGQTVREVADTLGCPEGTVKSNLHKAINRLRKTLIQRDGEWAAAPSKSC